MSNLFRGMVFIFINFNIIFISGKIDILPDFIGFFMIAEGLKNLSDQNENFAKIKPLSLVLGIYSFIIFLLNFSSMSNEFMIITGIVYTILLIYMTYKIIIGIMDMEKSLNTSLSAEALMSSWKTMTIFNVLLVTAAFIPGLNIIFSILSIVFIIAYLVSFNRTKNLYYEHNSNI